MPFQIRSRSALTAVLLIAAFVAGSWTGLKGRLPVADETGVTAKEELGMMLFFEESLSTPPGQSCSSCHDPAVAFADPDTGLPVSKGASEGLYGNRNDMTVTYASFIPPLHKDPEEDIWVGGLFWDGRVNSLEEQALGPPLNPLEMANPDTAAVAEKLRALSYADLFIKIYGPDALKDPGTAYRNMADAIAAFERTEEFHPFDSKYDHYLRGEAELTEQELRGLHIFEAEDKGNCAACHPSRPAEDGTPPLFTDFTYDNLGAPKNPENPFYLLSPELNPDGVGFVDLGLGVTVGDPAENGKFRVPTLRNIALTSPYLHNGVFKTLFQVVAFYNTRDVVEWPAPEVSENVNTDELGDLGLTNGEMEDLVAFMITLTDGWEKQ
jgi:cytochrome c peroxidase